MLIVNIASGCFLIVAHLFKQSDVDAIAEQFGIKAAPPIATVVGESSKKKPNKNSVRFSSVREEILR